MVIRLLTFFLIGLVLFTLFSLFLADFLGYLWVALAAVLVIGIAYLTFHYIKKIMILMKREQ
ncbi:hypothetical protein [Halobacillus sp. Marseille-Q1614]|uniref:hypothetical protein n=1 Tax=Halobacillus sp. Marseille-Q1614 TaxID=2709134 RepID=UPI00156F5E2F|nr:hypothetical protein [Halobacillus sp. Marseille-Q1614]